VTKVIAVILGDADLALPRLGDLITGGTCYVPFGEGVTGRDDPVAALVTLSIDGDAETARALDVTALFGAPTIEAYLVDERRQWDDYPAPVVGRASFVHRVPSLTRRGFAEHWSTVHAPLARAHHPGVCRYVQNVVIEPLTPGAPDVDGIAELSFRSETDRLDRMYDSPEGKQIIREDVGRFLDAPAGWRLLGREIRLPVGEPR
jgi:uncharacterized protein (TIGR02118 family)